MEIYKSGFQELLHQTIYEMYRFMSFSIAHVKNYLINVLINEQAL